MGGDHAWMFAASLSGQIVELKMPDGVGEPLPAGAQVMLAMHFTNTTTAVMQPQAKVNLIAAHDYQTKAAALVAFNTAIDIPAATASGPGTQTVTGSCTPPIGASFFVAGTHTNKHGTTADVNDVGHGQQTNVVHTTDWVHPDVAVWTAPSFLSIQSGDSLTYSCGYSNAGTTPVTVGETDQSNEVCMVVSYYFPAGTASCE